MMMFHGIASRVVDRSLRPLSKVHPGEGVSALLMLACIFLLLSSYYVLKTAREGLILAGGAFGLRGDELKAYATGGMALFLAVLVPLYGRLANRARRIRLINTTYILVAGCLPAFYALNALGVSIGLAFYVWLGIVSLLLIAQFWSYATDIYTEEQGKRLFPIVAVGGSLGAIIGPRLAKLTDTFTLLPIAGLMLIACLALFNAVERHDGRQPHHLVIAPITGPGGFALILRDRYLLLIALLLLVANLVNTTGEYILSNAVREHAIAVTADKDEQRELIKSFYGSFYSWVNLLTFLIQAFLVSRLIDKFGVRRMLFVLPILVMSAYSAVALVGGLAIIRAAKLGENGVDYSLQNTLRQTLFLPVERVAKYKAKAAIDTFCVRAGDLLAALLVGIGLHRLGMQRTSFALVNIALGALWIPLCMRLVRRHRKIAIASLLLVATAVASAEPRPGDESGRIDEPTSEDSLGRRTRRTLLVVPRGVVAIALAPVRLGVWASDRYHLPERAHRLFFNDAKTFGVYPTFRYDSTYGMRVGAQMVAGLSRQARLNAFAGGSVDGEVKRFDATYARATSRTDIGVGIIYEDLPERPLFAIGNVESGRSLFPSTLSRISTRGGYRLDGDLQLRGAMSIAERDALLQYTVGYVEAETLWDTRRSAIDWDTPGVHSRGSLVSLWGGHSTILDGRDFWRYGTDLHHNVRIGSGPRVLSLRFHGEAIDTAAADVPVTELPSLGGPRFLRGYPSERFRDRIAMVGTAEYQWDLSHRLFASVFVDSGRVYSSFEDLEINGLRTGYGAALELHAAGLQGVRGSIASSTDGGIELNFYLEPVFSLPSRVERR